MRGSLVTPFDALPFAFQYRLHMANRIVTKRHELSLIFLF